MAKGAHRHGLGRLAARVLLAWAVPLLAGVVLLLALEWRQAEDAQLARLAATASLAARGADSEIEARRIALLAFGASVDPGRNQDDLSATDAAARRLAAALGSTVGVLDRGLGLLVDTSQPFGTPLPSTPAIAAGLWAVETGRPRVSEVL